MLPHLSTSTPASEISSADFARMEAAGNDNGVNGEERTGPTIDDILRNSPAASLLGLKSKKEESLPEDEKTEAPENSDGTNKDDEVPSETSEDAETDPDEEQSQETDEEDKTDEDDQESTQEADLPTEEDIDWTYMVPVKIDGKIKHVSLEEIRKGYATDQHLSQKGRELGEQRKKIEEEQTTKLNEIVQIGQVLHNELMAAETDIAKQYAEVENQIKKAREEGDTYKQRELKDQREELQEKYWAARKKRESSVAEVAKKLQEKQKEDHEKAVAKFAEEIPTVVPGFDAKMAKAIREFSIKEGLPPELLELVYDARVVKFINDYRILKTAKDTGVAKRKAAPVAKSVPSKKGTPASVKQKQQETNLRTKVLSGQGSNEDQASFLKSISTIRHKL